MTLDIHIRVLATLALSQALGLSSVVVFGRPAKESFLSVELQLVRVVDERLDVEEMLQPVEHRHGVVLQLFAVDDVKGLGLVVVQPALEVRRVLARLEASRLQRPKRMIGHHHRRRSFGGDDLVERVVQGRRIPVSSLMLIPTEKGSKVQHKYFRLFLPQIINRLAVNLTKMKLSWAWGLDWKDLFFETVNNFSIVEANKDPLRAMVSQELTFSDEYL